MPITHARRDPQDRAHRLAARRGARRPGRRRVHRQPPDRRRRRQQRPRPRWSSPASPRWWPARCRWRPVSTTSCRSQRDTELADIARETQELARDPGRRARGAHADLRAPRPGPAARTSGRDPAHQDRRARLPRARRARHRRRRHGPAAAGRGRLGRPASSSARCRPLLLALAVPSGPRIVTIAVDGARPARRDRCRRRAARRRADRSGRRPPPRGRRHRHGRLRADRRPGRRRRLTLGAAFSRAATSARSAGRGRRSSSTSTPSRPSHPAIELELGGQLARRPRVGRRRVLGVRAAHPQRATPARSALRSTRGHEPVAEQERQHVVAVHPLGRGRVDLDAVPEPEEPLGPVAEPDQRVERREQGARARPAAAPRRPRCTNAGCFHPSTLRREQQALVHELGDASGRVFGTLRRK